MRNNIRCYRLYKGVSQRWLAQKVGCSHSTLGVIERGESVPHERAGRDVARAAQVHEVERIERQTRRNSDDPRPEQPHIEVHQLRTVVAAQGAYERRENRQSVGRGDPRHECAAHGQLPAAATAVFLLLNEEQKNALMQYILEQGACHGTVFNSCHTSFAAKKNPLTEIQEGELYLCLEHRTVRVRERMINLTSKEFDILALLIANPKRVFTYELITDLVWKEDCDFYSRKAIHNHISKLRKKLRFEPDLPNYIESVAGIGYKFEHL